MRIGQSVLKVDKVQDIPKASLSNWVRLKGQGHNADINASALTATFAAKLRIY